LGRLNIILLERKIGQTEVATQATVATANAKIDQANVSTDNSIRTTDAGVEATKAKAAAKPKGDK
jgi:hypothetical protein